MGVAGEAEEIEAGVIEIVLRGVARETVSIPVKIEKQQSTIFGQFLSLTVTVSHRSDAGLQGRAH